MCMKSQNISIAKPACEKKKKNLEIWTSQSSRRLGNYSLQNSIPEINLLNYGQLIYDKGVELRLFNEENAVSSLSCAWETEQLLTHIQKWT